MRNWKRAWLVTTLIVFAGIAWMFEGNQKQVNIGGVVLPKPTIIENKLKIAVMADIHNDEEELRIMLKKAKGNGVEMVVLAGDLTNNGKTSELIKIKEVLDESGVKYAAVPGNHEYYIDEFVKIFGKNYQSIRLGEVKLILVDNSYWKGLDEVHKKWLEGEVGECRVLICVAVMHKPLNNLFSSHVMGENNDKATAEALWMRELLITFGVRQIEAGHLHYASSYELEGIRTDIVGAVSRERNNQSPRYTELMIGRDLIERVVVEETDGIGN